jgi:hypothetical protein
MGERVSENYLDQLLNSINGEVPQETDPEPEKPLTAEEALERELFGEPDSPQKDKAKDEEAFMREFEEELLREDIPDYMENLEQELSEGKADGKKSLSDSIDDLIDGMPQELQEDMAKEPVVDENADFEGELPEEMPAGAPKDPGKSGLDLAVGAFDEGLDDKLASQPQEQGGDPVKDLPLTEDGELDLSGMSDSDLMAMLEGDQDLSDLGDMLSIDAEGKPLEEGDSIGDFAEKEMSAQEQAAEGKSAEGADKADGKKPGFLEKLKKLLFGEDEEDEDKLSLQGGDGADVAVLSAENEQILKELEDADGKKAKKEKKKKEKKPKKPKPKKQPKPKKPKPKKEKKPKQPDNTPPLPKGPVIAIIVMVASLFGLVMLGTSLLGYQSNISAAKEAEKTGDYVTAFESLQGMSVKTKDEQLYNRLSALAAVSKKYEAYLVFDNYGSKDAALDALVCAYGRCCVNEAYEEEYDCKEELEELKGKITEALLSEYNMTGEDALSIYEIKDRNEYTRALRRKLRDLGMEE